MRQFAPPVPRSEALSSATNSCAGVRKVQVWTEAGIPHVTFRDISLYTSSYKIWGDPPSPVKAVTEATNAEAARIDGKILFNMANEMKMCDLDVNMAILIRGEGQPEEAAERHMVVLIYSLTGSKRSRLLKRAACRW